MSAAILVCDDEPVHRGLINASLAKGDYRIYEVDDGRYLVGAVKSTGAKLVILDLRMPGADGIESLERLRAEDELADVRVLVLTGAVRERDREAALEAGADAFVTKPFSPRALAASVEELLSAQV
jgi:two-component system, OmpR family, response regulator MtrA